jgi:hypothetical protein
VHLKRIYANENEFIFQTNGDGDLMKRENKTIFQIFIVNFRVIKGDKTVPI